MNIFHREILKVDLGTINKMLSFTCVQHLPTVPTKEYLSFSKIREIIYVYMPVLF